jgi:hypothetical protein
MPADHETVIRARISRDDQSDLMYLLRLAAAAPDDMEPHVVGFLAPEASGRLALLQEPDELRQRCEALLQALAAMGAADHRPGDVELVLTPWQVLNLLGVMEDADDPAENPDRWSARQCLYGTLHRVLRQPAAPGRRQ